MSERLDNMIKKTLEEAMEKFDKQMEEMGWKIKEMHKHADELIRRMDLLDKSKD